MRFSLQTLLTLIALFAIAFFGVVYPSVWLAAAIQFVATAVLGFIVLGIIWHTGVRRAYSVGFGVFALTYLLAFCSFALPNGLFVTEEIMKELDIDPSRIMSVASSSFHQTVAMIVGIIGGNVSRSMWRNKYSDSLVESNDANS